MSSEPPPQKEKNIYITFCNAIFQKTVIIGEECGGRERRRVFILMFILT